jgi:uncharacterized protein
MFSLNGIISVHVKPGSKSDEILSYDESTKTLKVSLKAPAQDNKANEALIKFLSKTFKKKIRIKSGLTSKHKLVEVF